MDRCIGIRKWLEFRWPDSVWELFTDEQRGNSWGGPQWVTWALHRLSCHFHSVRHLLQALPHRLGNVANKMPSCSIGGYWNIMMPNTCKAKQLTNQPGHRRETYSESDGCAWNRAAAQTRMCKDALLVKGTTPPHPNITWFCGRILKWYLPISVLNIFSCFFFRRLCSIVPFLGQKTAIVGHTAGKYL